MKPFLLMVTFMTRIPIKINFDIDQEDFKSGIWYIPIIGIFIGSVLYAIYYFTNNFISPTILSLLLLVTYLLITGGLHIDGLADTFDALGSNRDKKRILEIMKDSHIGTFGVLSIVIYCLSMVAVLAEIPQMCLVFPILGRSLALFTCSISEYAREDGLGKTIINNTKMKHVLFSLVLLLLSVASLGFIEHSISVIFTILVPCIITLLIIWLITNSISKKLDGITGDIIGYIIEMSGIIFLILSYISHVIVGYI